MVTNKILSTTGELLTDCIKGEHLLCLFVLRFLRTSSSALTKHAQTAQAGKSSEDLGDSAETGAAQDMPQNFRGLRNFIDKNLSSYTVVLKRHCWATGLNSHFSYLRFKCTVFQDGAEQALFTFSGCLQIAQAKQEINWPDAGYIGTSHGHLLKSMLIDSTGSNSFCTWPKAPTWSQACSWTIHTGKCALRCKERSNGTRRMDASFLHLLLCLVQTRCPDFVAYSKCSILIPLYIFSVSITHKISVLPLLSLTICI